MADEIFPNGHPIDAALRSSRDPIVHLGPENRPVLLPMLGVLLHARCLAATRGIAVMAPFVCNLF